MKKLSSLILAAVVALSTMVAHGANVVQDLQDVSVTLRTNRGQGSGTMFTRALPNGDTVTFVWTAGHVVDGLRIVRSVIDPANGQARKVIQFEDAAVVKEFTENGRRVGEIKVDAKVIKFSPANQEDLALLIIRKKNHTSLNTTTKFYLDDKIPDLGTELFHVGSLLGQFGANSLTTGVLAQQGRVLNLDGNEVVFDQTTVTAFPGSSGGGVFLKGDGRYIGMLVRGAGEGFNFIVPVRRIRDYCTRSNILWAIDPKVELPSQADLDKMAVEESPSDTANRPSPADGDNKKDEREKYPFLLAP
jgi:hypothetical protein